MALDPNIPLQAGQGVQQIDPMRAMSNAYTLKAMMQQGEAAAFQQEQMRKAAQRDEAIRNAYVIGPDGKIDQPATSRNLAAAGGGQLAAALAHQSQMESLALKKADSDAQSAALTQHAKRRELVGPIFAALGETPTPEQIAQGARQAISMGVLSPDNLPQSVEQLPAWYQQQRRSFLSVEQQFRQEKEARSFTDPLLNLLSEQERFTNNQRAGAPVVPAGAAAPGTPTDLNAPPVGVGGRDPIDARMAQLAYGKPEAFRYDANGNIVANPQVQEYERGKAAAGASRVDVNMGKVETSARIGSNDDFIKNVYRPTLDRAAMAQKSNANIRALRGLSIASKTGWGTEAKAKAAEILLGLGMKNDEAYSYAADAQKFKSVVGESVWQLLAAQKGPQTEGDAKRAQEVYQRLGNLPEANEFISDVMEAGNNRSISEARFYRKGYSGALDKGDLSQLERDWAESGDGARSIWDDPVMKKWRVAVNPQTGQTVFSKDGGRTYIDSTTGQPVTGAKK